MYKSQYFDTFWTPKKIMMQKQAWYHMLDIIIRKEYLF